MRAGLSLALAAALAWPAGARAQTSSTFPFPPWHARAAAVGGAGVAARGLEFTVLNPAGLEGARGAQFSFHEAPAGSNDGLVTLAYGDGWGTASLAFQRRDWGAVAEELGLDDLSAGEQAIRLGYARSLPGTGLTVGAAVSRLDSDYLGVRTGGWAVDAGLQGELVAGLRGGVSVIHAGSLTNDEGEEVTVPGRLRAGTAFTRPAGPLAVTVLADVGSPLEGDRTLDAHLGSEVRYSRSAFAGTVRAGWKSLGNPYGAGEAERAWSFGGGIALGRIRADVARTTGGSLEDETFISLSLTW